MKILRHSLALCTLALFLGLGLIGITPQAEASGPPPAIIMETSLGRIILLLNPKEAPITVENFLRYVDDGFYDGTIFHRVVSREDFKQKDAQRNEFPYSIIQGGGMDSSMKSKRPTYPPIKSEAATSISNTKGTIAMARGADPDSATCQFFINVEDNNVFNYSMKEIKLTYETKEPKYKTTDGYAAFGKVIRGMDVVEKINGVKKGKKGRYTDVPETPVVIKRVYRAR